MDPLTGGGTGDRTGDQATGGWPAEVRPSTVDRVSAGRAAVGPRGPCTRPPARPVRPLSTPPPPPQKAGHSLSHVAARKASRAPARHGGPVGSNRVRQEGSPSWPRSDGRSKLEATRRARARAAIRGEKPGRARQAECIHAARPTPLVLVDAHSPYTRPARLTPNGSQCRPAFSPASSPWHGQWPGRTFGRPAPPNK